MQNENQSNKKTAENDESLTPKELTKKHLEDPKHIISEEEMKSLKTDPDADKELDQKEEEKLNELKNETGKRPPNPYDILSE